MKVRLRFSKINCEIPKIKLRSSKLILEPPKPPSYLASDHTSSIHPGGLCFGLSSGSSGPREASAGLHNRSTLESR